MINQESVDDCAKLPELPKTVDTRFDICKDIALVLKIGRGFQNKDGFRGAHYDTVKLLCDAIEYQQEQLKAKTEAGDATKMREALIKARLAICHFARYQCKSLSWENSNIQANCGDVLCSWRGLCEAKTAINAALAATSSQKEDNR